MSIYIQKPPLGTRINWGHPLTGGLVGCWLMNEGGGSVTDLVKGGKGLNYNYNGWKAGVGGTSPNFNDSYQIEYGALYLPKMEYFTFACSSKSNGNMPNFGRPFGKTYNNANTSPYVTYDFEYNPGGRGQNLVVANMGRTNQLYTTSDVNIGNATKPHTLVATIDRPGYLKFYVDGILKTQLAHAGFSMLYDDTSAGKFIIGGYATSTAGNFSGDVYWVYIWSRILSPQEIQALYISPYQFIQKNNYRFYSISSNPFVYAGTEIGSGEYAGMEIH